MNKWRILAGITALAIVAVVAVGLLYGMNTDAGDTADYGILIVGPDGQTMFDQMVFVENATALSALQAAGKEAGLAIKVDVFASMGECGEYVSAIGPYEATDSGGWTYEIWQPDETTEDPDDGEWTWGPVGAGCYAMTEGEKVRWIWSNWG